MAGLTTDICQFRGVRSAHNLVYRVLVVVEASDDAPSSIGDTGRGAAEDGARRTFVVREK